MSAKTSNTSGRSQPWRVFVVDDHEVVREGVRRLIDTHEDFRVVGDAGTHADALARIRATRPDLVVLDLQLPDVDGVTTCREILAQRPDARVLVLTAAEDPALVRDVADAGAAGYIVKTLRRGRIVDALCCVADGKTAFDLPRIAASVDQRSTGASGSSTDEDQEGTEAVELLSRLSDTERTVLDKVVEGQTNQGIAHDLGLSEKSVKKLLSSIYVTLGVTSRVAAAVIATRAASFFVTRDPVI